MIAAIPACFIYLTALYLQAMKLFRNTDTSRYTILSLTGAGCLLHGWIVAHEMFTPGGIDFGFFKIASLIACIFTALLTLSSIRKPLENLCLALLPLCICSIPLALLLPSEYHPRSDFDAGILSHIFISLLAYSVLTMGAATAILMLLQHRQLKTRQPGRLAWGLPPVQTMEKLLFEITVLGVILLTAAIASGLFFIDDIFAQHLIHKTVLTIIAWLLYAILLTGHFAWGWRGQVAARWSLAAFAFLMLAFFGTKIVLELILHET